MKIIIKFQVKLTYSNILLSALAKCNATKLAALCYTNNCSAHRNIEKNIISESESIKPALKQAYLELHAKIKVSNNGTTK